MNNEAIITSETNEQPILINEETSAPEAQNWVDEELTKEETEEAEEKQEDSQPEELKEKIEKSYNAAFKEERVKRQKLDKELRETNEKMQRMEELFQKVQQKLYAEPEAQIPDYEDDPIGNLKAKQDKLDRLLEQTNQERQIALQQNQYTQKIEQIKQDYQRDAVEFREENPDFVDAYKYLVDQRIRQYKAAGYDDNAANALFVEDELAVIANAKKSHRNAAELVYNIAKEAGFKAPKTETVMGKFNQLQEGIQASRSISTQTNRGNNSPMTLEKLAEMSPDDPNFNKYWDKLVKGR